MLNVPELRDKFHAARLKDSTLADVCRRHIGKILDELEMYQNSASAIAIDNGTFQSVIAAHKVPPDIRAAALIASYDLVGVQDQRATNLICADSLLVNKSRYEEERTKITNLSIRATLDKFHGHRDGACPRCGHFHDSD